MLKMTICVAAVIAMTTTAAAAPPVRGPVEYRFIGFTDDATNMLADTIDGGQGMLAMHALCQDDFGPDARMCTSEEFWLSPNAEAPAAAAWLHSFRPAITVDFTGFGGNAINCLGWTRNLGGDGNVVTADGKPSLLTCNAVVRPVTCCAPIK